MMGWCSARLFPVTGVNNNAVRSNIESYAALVLSTFSFQKKVSTPYHIAFSARDS